MNKTNVEIWHQMSRNTLPAKLEPQRKLILQDYYKARKHKQTAIRRAIDGNLISKHYESRNNDFKTLCFISSPSLN